MKHEIKKVLVLSTAHITKEVNETMLAGGEIGVVYDNVPYGYFMYIPSDLKEWALDRNNIPVPKCILDIISKVKELECDWCKLDCDGEVISGLTTYKW